MMELRSLLMMGAEAVPPRLEGIVLAAGFAVFAAGLVVSLYKAAFPVPLTEPERPQPAAHYAAYAAVWGTAMLAVMLRLAMVQVA